MTETDIQQMIAQLDVSVPKGGSKLMILAYDETNYYGEVVGNRNGYLRAALEFLRAATVPLESDAFSTPIDFNYLVPSQGGLLVKRLSRRDDVEAALQPKRQKTWKDQAKNKAAMVGCLSVFLFLAVCTLIGMVELGGWIFGK